MRTTTPSQTKSFSGFEFCKGCYEALELKQLEPQELSTYFLFVSNNNKRLFEALTSIASKFDKSNYEHLLMRCVRAMGDDATGPLEILAFLLAAKALEESSGSEPLTTVGTLALINIGKRIASDMLKFEQGIPDSLSEKEALKRAREQTKAHYTTCVSIVTNLTSCEYTEIINKNLTEILEACNKVSFTKEVDLSTFEKGIHLKISEELAELLLYELDSERMFCGWRELKETFEPLEKEFEAEGITLIMPDTEYESEIYVLVGERELYLTTQWELLKETIHTANAEQFITFNDIPLFALEKAASSADLLEQFVKNTLITFPDTIDLILLYTSILKKNEKIKEAITFLEEKRHLNESKVFIDLGMFYTESSQYEKAIECLQKAAEIDPEDWTISVIAGRICEKRGLYDQATYYYEKALDATPSNTYLINLVNKTKTTAALSAIEKALAEKDYEKALILVDASFDPFEISVFHYYKGLVLSRMGESRAALPVMSDYLDIFSEDEEGWLEKAGIYLDLGHFAAAARCFRQCAKLNPFDINPLVWEALCHKRLGRSRNYKRCINEAKKIDREGTKALLKKVAF